MKKTIAEQLALFEAKRAAAVAKRDEIQGKALEENRNKDAGEKEEFDTLSSEIKACDDEIADLKLLENEAVRRAAVVTGGAVETPGAQNENKSARTPAGGNGGSVLFTRSNLQPGVRMARYAMALIRAEGNAQAAVNIVKNDPVWMASSPELVDVFKAAVAAGDTTTSGWASELVYAQNLANEFIEYLRPKTIIGQIENFRRVPFNIRVGGLSGGTTGFWVGQGKPIPVSKGTSTSVSLGVAKAAGITAIDNELARLSTPSAELMIRNDLAKAIITLVDDSFINPNNGGVSNVSPASMTYGVTPVTPTGTGYSNLRADLATLRETAFDANLDTEGSCWIMSQTLAGRLADMVNALDQLVNPQLTVNGGTFRGEKAIVSQAAQIGGSPQWNDVLIWLHPQEVFLADDGQVAISASKETALQLDDSPTNQSTGGTTATSMISMFQTESMAIKAVRFINWTKRRSTAAQWIQAANYS